MYHRLRLSSSVVSAPGEGLGRLSVGRGHELKEPLTNVVSEALDILVARECGCPPSICLSRSPPAS